MDYWQRWCIFSFNNGLSNIYQSNTDYLPVYHYILFIFGQIQGSAESIAKYLYLLKAITLIFDFVVGFYLVKLLSEKFKDKNHVFTISLFYFFNICILFNTVIWGQVDGILACFVFTSFYYAYKNKPVISFLLYLLALNFKLQAIVFFPLIGLLLLSSLLHNFKIQRLLLLLVASFVFELLILLPFIMNHSVDRIWAIATGYFEGDFISANAFNIWEFFVHPDLWDYFKVRDTEIFLGINHKELGLSLFFIFSFIALFPLIKRYRTNKRIYKKKNFFVPLLPVMIHVLANIIISFIL